ncbi:MAG TPA: pyruvate kinase [Polyangiales bacterium]|nr:pyruvate kinase [Polyangiales bacterium]
MSHTRAVIGINYTKIIATVGPASSTLDQMRLLITSGADCFRLNMSHGGEKSMQPLIDRAREAAKLEGKYIPLLADIQGPKLRVGKLPLDGITLHPNAEFLITSRDVEGNQQQVHSPYEGLARDVVPGAMILLADGTIELRVERVEGGDVYTRVVTTGRLFSNKGLNLPGRAVSIPTLTEKDEADLAFAAKAGIDLIAISFVRSADDIQRARSLLGNTKTPVMAKLERPEALTALDSILAASDGVMVARGDLGVEMPFERVPVLQKQILRRASSMGKWAVVATQMLGSMVIARRPTRAEASDVANAVLDGADAVMLSEESATGANPELAVQAMSSITRHAEAYEHEQRSSAPLAEEDLTFAGGVASAAVGSASNVRAKAIVTLAGSGLTALHISKRRPHVPIVALGSWEPTLRRTNVLHGVVPVRVQDRSDIESQLQAADAYLRSTGLAEPGDVVVVAAAVPLGQNKQPNTIRFHRVRPPGALMSDPPPVMIPKK